MSTRTHQRGIPCATDTATATAHLAPQAAPESLCSWCAEPATIDVDSPTGDDRCLWHDVRFFTDPTPGIVRGADVNGARITLDVGRDASGKPQTNLLVSRGASSVSGSGPSWWEVAADAESLAWRTSLSPVDGCETFDLAGTDRRVHA